MGASSHPEKASRQVLLLERRRLLEQQMSDLLSLRRLVMLAEHSARERAERRLEAAELAAVGTEAGARQHAGRRLGSAKSGYRTGRASWEQSAA
jgi:hypothetical protein